MKQIDLVYLWCSASSARQRGVPDDEWFYGRCYDTADLKYSIASVRKYMPWVRQIFVVVDDIEFIPNWLDDVKLIRHSQIIPQEFLPTFNSNVIESFIHYIPTLSELFLYSNDDMYVGKPIDPSFFFTDDDKPIVRYKSNEPMTLETAKHEIETNPNVYRRWWVRSCVILDLMDNGFQHTIQPYVKSELTKFADALQEAVVFTATFNRMRASDDVNVLRFFTIFAVQNEIAVRKVTDTTVDLFCEADDEECIRSILEIKPALFCVNNHDGRSAVLTDILTKILS